jgi:hypothetical protein
MMYQVRAGVFNQFGSSASGASNAGTNPQDYSFRVVLSLLIEKIATI